MPAGWSSTRRYARPSSGTNANRPRPSWTVERLATKRSRSSSTRPATSAGRCFGVFASTYTRHGTPATRSPPSGYIARTTRFTTTGIDFAAVSTTPPSATVMASVASPVRSSFGSANDTAHVPSASITTSWRCTSTPSTVATAVVFAPTGRPPSARVTLRLAVTVSPAP
jgi:hypothetical protein